ncbi:hypothetical protein HAX54_052566 [Datura stramonium]|uniref:Uncharacterized protein n=1 Tax=Datura stramonium TaxID=4076 RepID=A0ABS8WRH7_DATST|nr:hypothetical protein [Datura stramonium]
MNKFPSLSHRCTTTSSSCLGVLPSAPTDMISPTAGPTQVAFGYGGSSSSLKSYGPLKGHNKVAGSMSDGGIGGQQVQKEYAEPWDYYTNYPVTLPLRRPYSGNPELLDEEEFGETSRSLTCDENSIKPAMELGLMDVVSVNSEEKYCSNIGELTKRVIITPDVDSILDSI